MKKKSITGCLAVLTFLLAVVALQFYFNKDHYFAMNRAKCSFTMIVFISAVLTALIRPIERIWKKQDKQKMTLLDWSVLFFGCTSLVTCVLSQAPELTLVGTKGMFVGAFTYFTGMLVYFVVSRNMIPNKWIVGILIAGWTVIFIWTIINRCGIDLFSMHENIRPTDQWTYVSSMGNANSACDAFAAIVPFIMAIIVFSTYSSKKYFLYLVCYIGLLASFTLPSDGAYIGMLVMFPFLIYSILTDVRKSNILVVLLLILGLTITTFHFMCICSLIVSPSIRVIKVANLWLGELLIVVSIILLYLHNSKNLKLRERPLVIIRNLFTWGSVLLLVVFVIVSVTKSSYDPNYGSERGAIWKGSVWSFRLYKPIEMIFGQGSGMFAKNVTLALTMLFGKESSAISYATCHNSLLQSLLGNGIIGLLCLLTGVYALIRDWFRDMRPIVKRPMSKYDSIRNVEFNEMIRVASFIAIMGYFGASLVESTYPHTVMLLFAMLALYRSSYFVPKKKKEKQPAKKDM